MNKEQVGASSEAMLAWHFLKADRRLAYPPHTPVFAGQRLTVAPERLRLCTYGLHASVRALDALEYAPGPVVCRVALGGVIKRGNDKVCASERTVLAMADATETLRAFARSCALDVIDKWSAPPVVRKYLATGNESLREAAASAAWAESAAKSSRCAASAARSESVKRTASLTWAARSVALAVQNARLEAMFFDLLQLQG